MSKLLRPNTTSIQCSILSQTKTAEGLKLTVKSFKTNKVFTYYIFDELITTANLSLKVADKVCLRLKPTKTGTRRVKQVISITPINNKVKYQVFSGDRNKVLDTYIDINDSMCLQYSNNLYQEMNRTEEKY